MLIGRVNQPPRNPRLPPKLILDPGQTSFGFEVPVAPKTPDAPPTEPTAKAKNTPTPPLAKAPASKDRRQRPVRARISFEAPMRLKRRLESAARNRDQSKTAILRAAVEAYLRHPEAEEDTR